MSTGEVFCHSKGVTSSKDGSRDDAGVEVKDRGVRRSSGADGGDKGVGVAWILMEKGVRSLACTGVEGMGRGGVFEEDWEEIILNGGVDGG